MTGPTNATAARAAQLAARFRVTGPARELLLALAGLADERGRFDLADLPRAARSARLDTVTATEAWQVLLTGGWVTVTGPTGHLNTT
jgi:hypothetical protein